jgi:hypothetical protein
MANEEQLSILKQGVEVWNKWRVKNSDAYIDLSEADLSGAYLTEANLMQANLKKTNLIATSLRAAVLKGANLIEANFTGANLMRSNFLDANIGGTYFGNSDLSQAIGLDTIIHHGPSYISTSLFPLSKGRIAEAFLRGCGLSDIDIEYAKLYDPGMNNDEKTRILYKMYDLQASQALQISPLFISYSHADRVFVDKLERQLSDKGIRFWRDIHEMKAGRIETQIDKALSQHPTVLLILSKDSLKSDWVGHEVRTARQLEKDMGRDVLCPVALDDSWKDSGWPKRIMEQIMEYNILDFSDWKDDSKFDAMFRKLIDGLELFYKG